MGNLISHKSTINSYKNISSKKSDLSESLNNIEIIDIKSISELRRYENAWNELLLKSDAASPMLSYQWISSYFETKLTHSETWICLFAYQNKKIIGILPLIIDKKLKSPLYSITFFKTPYDVFHTSSVDCITLKNKENVIEFFIDYIRKNFHTFPVITIRRVPKHSASMIYMKKYGRKACITCEKAGVTNFISVSGTYESYLNRLSTKFKKELRRKTRRLNELGNISFLLRENQRSIEENIKRLLQVEGSGWKGRNKTSIMARSGDADFHKLALKRLARNGWIDWYFLEKENKTIAVYSASRINSTIYGLKTGFDEQFAQYAPGNILFQRMVQNAFESGDVNEINCMSDMPWQKKWKMDQRTLYDLLILPNIPLLSDILLLLIRAVRSARKKNINFNKILKKIIN